MMWGSGGQPVSQDVGLSPLCNVALPGGQAPRMVWGWGCATWLVWGWGQALPCCLVWGLSPCLV